MRRRTNSVWYMRRDWSYWHNGLDLLPQGDRALKAAACHRHRHGPARVGRTRAVADVATARARRDSRVRGRGLVILLDDRSARWRRHTGEERRRAALGLHRAESRVGSRASKRLAAAERVELEVARADVLRVVHGHVALRVAVALERQQRRRASARTGYLAKKSA